MSQSPTIVTGHHKGLFDLIAQSIDLLEHRDDEYPETEPLDQAELFELVLTHLPGYLDAVGPLSIYHCIHFLRDELNHTDLAQWMFSPEAYQLDLVDDYYILYLRPSTCN